MASARLFSASDVENIGLAGAKARFGDKPDPTACAVAYEEYRRQSAFSTLFTVALLVLVAATVVFLVALLSFLAYTLLQWNDKDMVANGVKIAATLGSAVGTLTTGGAAKVVRDEKNAQDLLVASAQKVVNQYCKATK
ncbi:MAG: hypothetical protein ABSB75_08400 [Candidatus Limnocylindrales bacterium]|jgi:hypothetical protein